MIDPNDQPKDQEADSGVEGDSGVEAGDSGVEE